MIALPKILKTKRPLTYHMKKLALVVLTAILGLMNFTIQTIISFKKPTREYPGKKKFL